MSYIVYTSSGTILTTVATGKVNTVTTSLTLIGRDVTNYGRYYNQNLVNILGNFASRYTARPGGEQSRVGPPILGQLWYNMDNHKLYIYNGQEFRPAYSTPYGNLDAIVDDGVIGELFLDTKNNELNFVDANEDWQTITSYPRDQISGWKHPPVDKPVRNDGTGTSAVVQQVTLLQHYGSTIGALSLQAFTASEKDSTSTFSLAGTSSYRVAAGLSIIGELQVTTATFQRVNITGADDASSTTTGALTVLGGVGIRGDLYVGGEIVANKLTVELTTVTTTIVETDDVITTFNTTDSVSTDTGALVIAGGAGIGLSLTVGNTATVQGELIVNSTATIQGELIVNSTATFVDTNITGNLIVSSLSFIYSQATGNFTATTETIVGVNSANTCTITLPVLQSGRFVVIKDESGAADINNIIIVPQSGTIDGDPSALIDLGYSAYNFYCNGTNWFIV